MKITFEKTKVKNWGKWRVHGGVIGRDSKGRQVQEVLQTIHSFGKFRMIRNHSMKFTEYS